MASDSAWKDQGSSGQFEVPGELNRSDLLWHLLLQHIRKYILGNSLIQVQGINSEIQFPVICT